jgi:ribonuclease P protein component
MSKRLIIYKNEGKLDLGFPKHYKLTSKKAIGTLFKTGKKRLAPPFVYYYQENTLAHNQYLIAVPKRKIKSAVKRQLLKRRMREAIRHSQEHGLTKNYSIAVLYNATLIYPYSEINEGIDTMLNDIRTLEI